MSLSNAISNAMSGIVAASRGTEVVASNLANALTPGFARRELQISAQPYVARGGGVHVDGVTRAVRTSIVAQGRLASAETARAGTLATFQGMAAKSIGVPGEAGALTTLLSEFGAALTAAAARPESDMTLGRAVTTAQNLIRKYGTLGTELQAARTAADQAIDNDVKTLNQGLARVVDLNRQITMQLSSGDDASALQDSRQQLIDSLSEIVPLQELPREGGRVALFTASGAVLLDSFSPTEINFSAAGPFSAGMTVGSPPVRRLTINGTELTAGQMSLFGGGRLAANFQIRDIDAPAGQARLDAASADLIDRFSGSNVDPTNATGPGLFTDAGAMLDPTHGPGLAQRLALNVAVDPSRGAEVWRLRDGLGAPSAGPVGDASLLDRMRTALTDQRLTGAVGLTTSLRTAATLASDITSLAATGHINADSVLSGAAAQSDSYAAMIRSDGVDSDREMETLLTLQRAYAANAKVLSAVDEMMKTILGLT